MAEMFADTQFNYGTRLLADAMSRVEPRTWRYLFLRRRPHQQDGPHHGEEVSYVFGNLDPTPPGEKADHDAVDEAVSAAMRAAWVAFASNADPNSSSLPRWRSYDPEAENHLAFGDTIEIGAGWRKPQLDFLERFYGPC